jgi:hypothetical protein
MDLSDASDKSPVTRPGVDLGTFRLVAQRLNHYATPGPHRDTNHPKYENRDIKFSQAPSWGVNNLLRAVWCKVQKLIVPYYRVSYRIVPAESAQTVSETLIKPCGVEMPTFVLGEHSGGGMK